MAGKMLSPLWSTVLDASHGGVFCDRYSSVERAQHRVLARPHYELGRRAKAAAPHTFRFRRLPLPRLFGITRRCRAKRCTKARDQGDLAVFPVWRRRRSQGKTRGLATHSGSAYGGRVQGSARLWCVPQVLSTLSPVHESCSPRVCPCRRLGFESGIHHLSNNVKSEGGR